MSKASVRSLLVVAILALIIGLIGVNIWGPAESTATIQLEEAGLIGALIAALSSDHAGTT